jgi:L-malate glycosyltransferase
MKILHINTERTWRGGEQQTLYLLQSLTERRIDCHLVCQPESPLAQKAHQAGLEVFPIAMRGEADLLAAFRLRQLISEHRHDIVHSHTSHGHALAFIATIGCKTWRLVTRRVDFSIFRHSFLHLSGLKYRFMAHYYIAISQKIKDVLVKDGIAADRIFVVHSGIDLQRFSGESGAHLLSEFKLKPAEQIVINVAHLAGHKGQEHLIRAIPYVLKKIPRVRFFIIGDGELMPALSELACSLGINQVLTFTGFRRDVGAFYQIADLFVMSSVQEGLGTAMLDALALGKAVVATNAGGIPEVITDGETGRLVDSANPVALAEGIIDLLSDPEQARRMAECGRALVQKQFSIETMAEKNIAVYQRLLAPGGRCLST